MVTRVRMLLAALLFAAATAPAPAYTYDVMIRNPLPNRVWLTVYLNGQIRYHGWLNGSLHYQTRLAAMTVMAEIAKLDDNRPSPETICKTDMGMTSSMKVITIRYNPERRNCWWEYQKG